MNKTTNYNLNQWEATDVVKREDFNADNAAIDAALKTVADAVAVCGNCAIYTRTYTGTGLVIERGATVPIGKPIMLMVMHSSGSPSLLAFRGASRPIYSINDRTEFVITWNDTNVRWYNPGNQRMDLNDNGETYYAVVLSLIA